MRIKPAHGLPTRREGNSLPTIQNQAETSPATI